MNQEWFIPSFLITLMAQDGWSRVETQALICKLREPTLIRLKDPGHSQMPLGIAWLLRQKS